LHANNGGFIYSMIWMCTWVKAHTASFTLFVNSCEAFCESIDRSLGFRSGRWLWKGQEGFFTQSMYDYHHLWNIQGLYSGLDSNKRFVGWLTAGENKLDKWGHIKWQSWPWYICCRSNFKPKLPMLRVCSWCRDICFSCLHWCSGDFLISRFATCGACEILASLHIVR
jgi:hypothetical protein